MVALMEWEGDTSYVTAITHTSSQEWGIKSLRIPGSAKGISGSCKPSVKRKRTRRTYCECSGRERAFKPVVAVFHIHKFFLCALVSLPIIICHYQIRSDQSLSRVQLFATPWIAARQASLSITNSQSSLKLMSIESMMPSSHLILCRPLLLLPPMPPSISVFSNKSTVRMRWPKY